MQNEPLNLEEVYCASVDEVWNAITVHEQMLKWYFDTIQAFIPVVGFETQVNVHANDHDYLHLWKVTEVEIHKKLTYSWKYVNYVGDSTVRWELFPDGRFTKLKLTHSGIESFPQDSPDFSRKSFMEGWSFILCKQLKGFLNKI